MKSGEGQIGKERGQQKLERQRTRQWKTKIQHIVWFNL